MLSVAFAFIGDRPFVLTHVNQLKVRTKAELLQRVTKPFLVGMSFVCSEHRPPDAPTRRAGHTVAVSVRQNSLSMSSPTLAVPSNAVLQGVKDKTLDFPEGMLMLGDDEVIVLILFTPAPYIATCEQSS
jgi:hypothetical protein